MGWIATTNNPATTQVTFAGNSNVDVNPANETEVTLKAKWKYTKGIHSIANMQQMAAGLCKASTTPNRTATTLDTDGSHHGDSNYVPTVTLTDTRDNNTYTVSKLADGRCWMTQNLRIAGRTITPADSNVTSSYAIPASSDSGYSGANDHTASVYVNSDGGFYTWAAATAGTGNATISTDGQNAPASICPKGWRLPTGGGTGEFRALYNNYNSVYAMTHGPAKFTLSGFKHPIMLMGGIGHYGYYWSSTASSDIAAYSMGLSNTVSPDYSINRYSGFSVRCITDDPTIHSISTMQQMTPEICAATTTPKRTSIILDTDGSHAGDPNYVPTKNLTDTRDNNTYTVSKLADGKCWMTQNLRIAGKTLTSTDSDVTSNYTIPTSSMSGFYNNDVASVYMDSTYGGYYSWPAATAGTGTTALSIEGQNAPASICSKGWRLPTGDDNGEFKKLYDVYGSDSFFWSSPMNFLRTGYMYSGSAYVQGYNYARAWSSTVHSSTNARYLRLDGSVITPNDGTYKAIGNPVRCVAR